MNRETVFQDYSQLIDPRIKAKNVDIVAAGNAEGEDSLDLGVSKTRARWVTELILQLKM